MLGEKIIQPETIAWCRATYAEDAELIESMIMHGTRLERAQARAIKKIATSGQSPASSS